MLLHLPSPSLSHLLLFRTVQFISPPLPIHLPTGSFHLFAEHLHFLDFVFGDEAGGFVRGDRDVCGAGFPVTQRCLLRTARE